MTPYYADESVTLYHGDCLDVLAKLPDASVDSIVTDPPYGLEFMGRDWDGADGFRRSLNPADAGRDSVYGRTSRTSPEYRAGTLYQQWCEVWAAECLRVLKPGGYLLAFGGTRTYHRLTCAIEHAGFEIRDEIAWLYGSGFPKSLDVSKAIDKAAGAEREVVGRRDRYRDGGERANLGNANNWGGTFGTNGVDALTAPATDDAKRWDGWGTALKPAHEPIVVARKPLAGTVAGNVLTHGTGALNIDACRIDGVPPSVPQPALGVKTAGGVDGFGTGEGRNGEMSSATGRWPTNVVLSHAPLLDESGEVVGDACVDGCVAGCPVAELDRQSGDRPGMGARVLRRGFMTGSSVGSYNDDRSFPPQEASAGYDDHGGASRFFPVFRYEAKADSAERPRVGSLAHPTVKPLDLMRWLVRLVTPPGGLVLDPFAGSGTTAEACVIECLRCIAVEREADYLPLIVARLAKPLQPVLDMEVG